ncbi:MAG: DUF5813 family protein [Halobacteriota archaeon]
MSELPARVDRAFRDHSAFEPIGEDTYESVTTPFEAVVEPTLGDGGTITFDVSVTVPLLNDVTEDDVATVVEDGWFETFQLRVEEIGAVTKRDRTLEPAVSRSESAATVRVQLEDVNERRGVDDANAVINYVEGTYVQGIIPGYEYTDPVSTLVSRARSAAGTD